VKRTLKWTFGALVIVAVLAIAAIVALPLIVDTPRAQTLIATSASQALGRPVTFASVSLVVFPRPAVELHALEIGEDPQFGTAPFLKLDKGRLALRVRPLLAGHVEFSTLTLKQPAISLIRNPDGRLNVATLGAVGSESRTGARPGRGGATGGGGGTGVGALARVRIEKGAVTYVARGGGGALTRYRIEDLDLTLTAGSTLRFSGNARVKPGDLAVKIAEGRLALNGARSLAEAPVSGRVTVDGKDVAELVADAVGPAGVVTAGPRHRPGGCDRHVPRRCLRPEPRRRPGDRRPGQELSHRRQWPFRPGKPPPQDPGPMARPPARRQVPRARRAPDRRCWRPSCRG